MSRPGFHESVGPLPTRTTKGRSANVVESCCRAMRPASLLRRPTRRRERTERSREYSRARHGPQTTHSDQPSYSGSSLISRAAACEANHSKLVSATTSMPSRSRTRSAPSVQWKCNFGITLTLLFAVPPKRPVDRTFQATPAGQARPTQQLRRQALVHGFHRTHRGGVARPGELPRIICR
jgi:hypothetical protein